MMQSTHSENMSIYATFFDILWICVDCIDMSVGWAFA